MPKPGRTAGWLAAILLLVAVAVFAGWRDYTRPGPLAAPKVVVIAKGASLRDVTRTLAAAGVIDHPYVFAIAAYLSGRGHGLQAGEYDFTPAMSARAVADLIASGKVMRHRLTIPEGLTSAEVVALIDAAPALTGTIDAEPPEGTLLPDTYFYARGNTRQEILNRMHRAMERALATAWASRTPNLPLDSPAQAVTLASIVEKETARPDERARIAGVYIERLKRGMKLQADPTVIYVLTKGGAVPLAHPLNHDDLSAASPYNTYLEKGLPPTPIANPGLAALHAAVQPEDRGELYFVADGSGGHVFAKTLDEHNRNVAKLRSEQNGG
jgi:peptidoglycan lytic transglycosylase G